MRRFLTGAFALGCALAMTACAPTSTATSPTNTVTGAPAASSSLDVVGGQALLGATLGADTALKTLQTLDDTGALSDANCQTVAGYLPDLAAALAAADVAWNAADATTLQGELADALQVVPILTGLAAAPAATETPTSPVTKASTLETIVALLPSLLSGVEDASAVSAADTSAALQAAIPAAQSQLAADADNFGC